METNNLPPGEQYVQLLEKINKEIEEKEKYLIPLKQLRELVQEGFDRYKKFNNDSNQES